MLDGRCPKCGSNEIYTDEHIGGKTNIYGLNQVVTSHNLVGFGPYTEFDNYLCGKCGYLERYVTDTSERERLIDNWRHVKVKE